MAEYLKKEFQDNSELQRLRNLISKKYGDRTKIQVGYEKQHVERNEGDVWEENGKEWTIKDGIKISKSRVQSMRDLIKIPIWCPKCGGHIKTVLDKKMYSIYSHCFDCQIKIETKMKLEGTFDKFEEDFIKSNVIQMVKDVEYDMQEYLKSNPELLIVTGEGEREQWDGQISPEEVIREVKEMTEAVKKEFKIEDE